MQIDTSNKKDRHLLLLTIGVFTGLRVQVALDVLSGFFASTKLSSSSILPNDYKEKLIYIQYYLWTIAIWRSLLIAEASEEGEMKTDDLLTQFYEVVQEINIPWIGKRGKLSPILRELRKDHSLIQNFRRDAIALMDIIIRMLEVLPDVTSANRTLASTGMIRNLKHVYDLLPIPKLMATDIGSRLPRKIFKEVVEKTATAMKQDVVVLATKIAHDTEPSERIPPDMLSEIDRIVDQVKQRHFNEIKGLYVVETQLLT